MSALAYESRPEEKAMAPPDTSTSPAGYSGRMEQIVAATNATNALEGIEPSALIRDIQGKLIAGKMTMDEALKKVIAAHTPSNSSVRADAAKMPVAS
jgi:Antitoxin VbhA